VDNSEGIASDAQEFGLSPRHSHGRRSNPSRHRTAGAASCRGRQLPRAPTIPIRSLICSATCSSGIRDAYVEKPDDAKLVEGAINGMISSLDPHSRYMNEKGWGDMQETTHGEFGGSASKSRWKTALSKWWRPSMIARCESGILSGDLITQIDDEAIQGLTLDQAVNR